jgi:hypothetical protein
METVMTTPKTTAELPSTGTLNITIRCEFTPGSEEIFRDCEIKIVHEAFKWVMESSSLFGAPEFRFDV